jgi:hypothetical protein
MSSPLKKKKKRRVLGVAFFECPHPLKKSALSCVNKG